MIERPQGGPATPCLVIDLGVVQRCYAGLRAALPGAAVHYAVKANPAPAVLATLVGLGCSFDVASPGEIALCLAAGARPAALSYGNPVHKRSDVVTAWATGVRVFSTDSVEDVQMLAEAAPGASVHCRIRVDEAGSTTPFGGKFGCSATGAVQLLAEADALGLAADGVAFHVGSQQREPGAWAAGIAAAAEVRAGLGRPLRTLNLGGGFPVPYSPGATVPPLADCAAAITVALARWFPGERPHLVIEPGRAMVADSGVIHSEVVQVTERDGRRWVYLDVGRYSGLAETEGEAVVYRLVTPGRGGPTGPVVLAGPSCDGDDVLYRRAPVELPLTLRVGDRVDICSAGAYTASYASVGFNGFPPLPTYCTGGPA